MKEASPLKAVRSPIVAPRTSPLSKSHKTPAKPSGTAAAPVVPTLQLSIKACEDEVTPVKTLYSRLFHEAQQREQRQAQAQQKQKAALKAEEKEQCTFRPRGADAFGRPSSPASKKRAASAGHRTQTATGPTAAAAPVPPSSSRASPPPTPSHHDGAPVAAEETAACERLFKNAVQAERWARRRQQLLDAEEEEFRSTCPFHPCVSPRSASRQRGVSNSRRGHEAKDRLHDGGDEGGRQDDDSAVRGASLNRSGTSPRDQPRLWEHFLADQEERQAAHERDLEELKKRAAERNHVKLYTGVPQSKASEHLKRYLEKKKGYKGPIEGWAERFEHYMKVKQAAEAEAPTTTPQKKNSATNHADGDVARTPVSGRSRSRTRSKSNGAATGRSPSVFHRLYHDSDEREAMRELISLMKEQQEQTEFFKPNAGEARMTGSKGNAVNTSNGNGSCNLLHHQTPRRSQPSPDQAVAARETAAAVALAAGAAGMKAQDDTAVDSPRQHDDPTTQSIFDTLYAEKEKLQRRREIRHLQAQNSAEVFSFHPHVNARSRELAKDMARQRACGGTVESVRERRAREAAQAQAQEAARLAQVQFRYDSFAHRQTERDRRRQKELLRVLLQERGDDVVACRFRPAISEVSEAIVEGNKNYTQVIDDPQVTLSLMRQRASSSSASKPAGHDASALPTQAEKSPARQSAAKQAAEGGRSTSSAHAPPFLTPVQALAADAEEADRSIDAGATVQWYDALSAPVHTQSATSSNSSDTDPHRTEHHEQTHSLPHAQVGSPDAKGSATGNSAQRGDVGGELGTVHIAGAASSDYLRQLESELQDALKDWSQCI
ncbi:hypothetical protein ABB37_01323 [Leptomonas pyrrhocoris]|uniref:Uncharacterized protein n=1 Tax=Leptomonas pyrrhocoris TaxID=157538 RepID=A0A0N0DZ42_LEPPY|nr:hypothetical protein ABB37_01323 [Leptomonas pyrrhocoris]KPA84855.1 hypothetical protein ABB37_01323 [Leptomonas pyrrhocoris]|eukprot:XP_015663294.1 hypothetical protein ABB37_01323 [Leptomonas pyrrhocoris]